MNLPKEVIFSYLFLLTQGVAVFLVINAIFQQIGNPEYYSPPLLKWQIAAALWFLGDMMVLVLHRLNKRR